MIFAKSGCGMRRILIFLMMGIVCTTASTESNETTDGEESRKILGSSDVCIGHNGYRKWNESRFHGRSR
ncbi:unnamed protein product [Callosobruchus maculatus]|uniref:Secreted protein n=1 Tax=Callosobruchus maculatus TaxID=64391 RepID=A0A653CEU6_CALMS|nr:unnamed protein product [Callosobruchus maculatus]